MARAEAELGQTRAHYARSRMQLGEQPQAIRYRLATAARLRQTLYAGHDIQPWYQPKINMQRGTLIGTEARPLARRKTGV